MKFQHDIFTRFPHRVLRKLSHKYTRLISAISLIILLTIVFIRFYVKDEEMPFDNFQIKYKLLLEDIQNYIDKEITQCLLHKERKDQNKAFQRIRTHFPIKPIRLTLTTAVFKFETQDEKFIIKRIIVPADSKLQESVLSMKLKHENVVKTFYTVTKNFYNGKENLTIDWLYSEFLDVTVDIKSVARNTSKIRSILIDVIKGVEYMHEQNIIHLDIKISNVMGIRTHNGIVYKLIDFGFSRQLILEESENRSFVVLKKKAYGTFPYKPPEVVLRNKHGKAADIWCIGAMALFLANGNIPFKTNKGEKDIKSYRKFIKGELGLKYREGFDINLKSFIEYAMNLDENNRPNIKELANHSFITNGSLDYSDPSSSSYYTSSDI